MKPSAALAVIAFVAGAGAGAAHATPTADHPLEDTAGVVSAADEAALEPELVALRTDTGVRFGVMVIQTTGGQSIEAYTRARAGEWSTGTNAAALLVLAIKDRKSRLEVSDLLRPSFPDARAQAILDNVRGYLRKADYPGAIRAVMTEVRNGATGIAPDLESPHPQVPEPTDTTTTTTATTEPATEPYPPPPNDSEPSYSEPKDHSVLWAIVVGGALVVLGAFLWAKSRVASRATLTAEGTTYAGRGLLAETIVCVFMIIGGLIYIALILAAASGSSSRGYSSSSSTWSGGSSSSGSRGGGWSGGGASSSW